MFLSLIKRKRSKFFVAQTKRYLKYFNFLFGGLSKAGGTGPAIDKKNLLQESFKLVTSAGNRLKIYKFRKLYSKCINEKHLKYTIFRDSYSLFLNKFYFFSARTVNLSSGIFTKFLSGFQTSLFKYMDFRNFLNFKISKASVKKSASVNADKIVAPSSSVRVKKKALSAVRISDLLLSDFFNYKTQLQYSVVRTLRSNRKVFFRDIDDSGNYLKRQVIDFRLS